MFLLEFINIYTLYVWRFIIFKNIGNFLEVKDVKNVTKIRTLKTFFTYTVLISRKQLYAYLLSLFQFVVLMAISMRALTYDFDDSRARKQR